MAELHERVSAIVMEDPAVYNVFIDIGGGAMNQGHINITSSRSKSLSAVTLAP
jgi:HAE1 family hydrophobic/amphiphilic exporter-1